MESTARGGDACSSRACRGCYGEIAEIVACTKGVYWQQTQGKGDAQTLNVIWRSMGDVLEDFLVRTKSCIIPDFLHASIKVHTVTLYSGERTHYKPQLVLLPDFMSKFHLRNVLVMPDMHYHATVPCNVGYSTVAAMCGANRFVVEAAVKDSIREIGKYLQRNLQSTLTIDIGPCVLEFRGREYRVKWSQSFLDRLSAAVGPMSLVSPYDPPSMTKGGPASACRMQKGCTSQSILQADVAKTLDAESRLTLADMNDGMGGSGYRKTHW